MNEETGKSGWELVASEEKAPAVIAGILDIDPTQEYTRSELAESAGVPLKTLYLIDIFTELETAGMLERVDDVEAESETCFRINDESDVYQAAEQFDTVVAEHLS